MRTLHPFLLGLPRQLAGLGVYARLKGVCVWWVMCVCVCVCVEGGYDLCTYPGRSTRYCRRYNRSCAATSGATRLRWPWAISALKIVAALKSTSPCAVDSATNNEGGEEGLVGGRVSSRLLFGGPVNGTGGCDRV